ncbi:MAG: hypothetical protein JWN36_2953 [Microbacteriaceae bacterium]|nr:hypothetical protein [Microbacteriaceae bacterium]
MSHVDTKALAAIADELYALDPAEFTAARNARAKGTEGELAASVKALRKPSAAAALVNRIAREQTAGLDELAALGQRIREAQDDGDRDALLSLGAERREQIAALTDALGRTAAATEVAETLAAAVVDPMAAAAVRSGRLVRALAPGDDDPSGAVAVPEEIAPVPAPKAKPRASGESARLKKEAEATEARDAEAAAAQRALEKRVASASDEVDRVTEELRLIEEQVRAKRGERDDAAEALADAKAVADSHAEEARSAHSDAVRARRKADSR